jgi:cytochrome c-type biogenesis protein CcmH/NrfG
MTLRLAAIAAAGGAGFAVAGAIGALVVGAALLALSLAWPRLRMCKTAIPRAAAPPTGCASEEHLQEVVDSLDDVARARGWDIEKLYAIARMSCRDGSASIEELECRYQAGDRTRTPQTDAQGAQSRRIAPGAEGVSRVRR